MKTADIGVDSTGLELAELNTAINHAGEVEVQPTRHQRPKSVKFKMTSFNIGWGDLDGVNYKIFEMNKRLVLN